MNPFPGTGKSLMAKTDNNAALLEFIKSSMIQKPAEKEEEPVPKHGRLITRATTQAAAVPSTRPVALPSTQQPAINNTINKTDSDFMMASLLPGGKNFNFDVDFEGLSDAQRRAFEAILCGKNILLTGPAGTGKSYLIKKISELYKKRDVKVGITSTTGASAVLVEGKTIHSWSGIGICGSNETALKRVMTYKAPQERIRSTNLLIIDEVSMLSGHLLDILDYVFKMIRNNQSPFGGIQVILCGDFYQLKPVKSDAYAFDSKNWDSLIQEVHELTYIFRQDNASFCKALNEIRIGEVSDETVALLSQCMGRKFEGDIKPTELYPLNEDVSHFNSDELWKLASDDNPVRQIDALDQVIQKPKPRYPNSEKFLEEVKAKLNKDCMAEESLQLLIGAQVMLLKNLNVEAGLANGSRGVVIGFGNQREPIVKFLNNIVMNMQTHTWTMRINETTKVKRTQYPLKLAFSISIHKSQGMSIDLVKADLGSKIFTDGQLYTALSRVRSLEGLSLIAIDFDSVLVSKKVKAFYAKHKK